METHVAHNWYVFYCNTLPPSPFYSFIIAVQRSVMKTSILPVLFGVPLVGYAFVPVSPLARTVITTRQVSRMSAGKGADNNSSIRSRIQGVAVALALSTSIALGAPSGPALAEELPAGQYEAALVICTEYVCFGGVCFHLRIVVNYLVLLSYYFAVVIMCTYIHVSDLMLQCHYSVSTIILVYFDSSSTVLLYVRLLLLSVTSTPTSEIELYLMYTVIARIGSLYVYLFIYRHV